jgi:hypothetical protein
MGTEQIYCHRDYTKTNVYKIGKTTQLWHHRLYQLNHNTGSLEDNTLEPIFVKHVANCSEAETYLHTNLQQFRINNKKEFFAADIALIKYWFDQVPGIYIVNNMPPTEIAVAVPIPLESVREPLIVRAEPLHQKRNIKLFNICCLLVSTLILVGVIVYIARLTENY